MNYKDLIRIMEDDTVRLLRERPDLTQKQIADLQGVSLGYVRAVAIRRRATRKRGGWRNKLA
jgi:hypothetical protein